MLCEMTATRIRYPTELRDRLDLYNQTLTSLVGDPVGTSVGFRGDLDGDRLGLEVGYKIRMTHYVRRGEEKSEQVFCDMTAVKMESNRHKRSAHLLCWRSTRPYRWAR